jgi:hypothetical protein
MVCQGLSGAFCIQVHEPGEYGHDSGDAESDERDNGHERGYKLLGEAYVADLMNGRFAERWKETDFWPAVLV